MTNIIAIDGPAGAGKSTVARSVATRLGFTYLDTGAMYRSVAWQALINHVDANDVTHLTDIAKKLMVDFGELTPDGSQSVTVNGVDATTAIRTPQVSGFTSTISTIAELRRVVVEQQRAIAARSLRGVVLEGRDIGTVVFPNASLKVFLTASAGERARRRVEDMNSHGIPADYESVLQDQIERDRRDSSRKASPLVAARDAVTIDTDGMSIDDVVSAILDLHKVRASLKLQQANSVRNDS